MIAVKETDEMATLAEAAEAYRATKEAHRQAAKEARAAVLAALKAGRTVPEVTKAGPFTYAYVRGIAEKNEIPRDERKARYQKHDGAPEPAVAVPTAPPARPLSSPTFMSASDRTAELIAMAGALPSGRHVELVSLLEKNHWAWLRANRRSSDSDWDVVQKAVKSGLFNTSDLMR